VERPTFINQDPLPGGQPLRATGDDSSGVQVPDHRLLRRIGRGSYGEVWLAQNSMGTFRAVKIVYRHTFQVQRPFDREWMGIRRFEPISRSHEGFLDVLHVGVNENQGYFYYVMELGDDQGAGQTIDPKNYTPKTLASEITRSGSLPCQDCLQLGLALSQALAEMHKQGLVHRDVKPSNIVYVNGIPKLADIGLVAEVQEARSYVGTEGFIPPEGPGTPAADVYSLGKVLYEASTGKDRQDFPELPTLVDQRPDFANLLELNEVILQACKTDAAERYPSGWEMHADLLVLANGKSVKRLKLLERRFAQVRHVTGIAALALVVCAALFYNFYREWKTGSEARQRKIGTSIAYGTRAMDAGDLLGALPYFAETLQWIRGDSLEELDLRLRLGSTRAQCPRIVQMWFGEKQVDTIRLSSDEQKLLVVEWGGKARVYDVATAEPVSPPFGQEVFMWRSDLSPDGSRAVTAGDGGTACVWRVSDGAKLLTLPHPKTVRSACFSPDGSRVVTGCADSIARVWDATSGEFLFLMKGHRDVVLFAGYNRDGSQIVTTSQDGTARLWDARGGQSLNRVFGHPNWVGYADFSPDGKALVTACFDHRARLWDLTDGQRVPPDLVHADGVMSAVFSPDGRLILTAGLDQTAQLWSVADHQLLNPNPFLRHSDRVTHAVFDRTGHRVATACADGTVRLWDLAGCAVAPQPVKSPVSDDGTHFLGTQSNGLCVFETASGGEVSPIISPGQSLKATKLSRDGTYLLTISTNATGTSGSPAVAEVWRSVSGERVGPPVSIPDNTSGFDLSINGQKLMAYDEKSARVWNTITGVLLSEKQQEEDGIGSAAFSPSADLAATWGGGVVRVWNVSNSSDRFPALRHPFPVKHVEFSSDGGRLVICGAENSFDKCPAQVWNALTGKAVGLPLKHGDGIMHAAFSPDARRIVTASEDFTAAVWDARTGLRLTVPLKHGNTVMSASFSTDNRWVVTASADKTARVWSASSGDPLIPSLHHLDLVKRARFLPGNRHLVTSDGLGAFSAWPLEVEAKPMEDVVALAHLLSGGGVTGMERWPSLKKESLASIWRRLRTLYPADFSTAPTQVATWHEFEADEAYSQRQWAAVVFHLERLRSFRPGDARLLERLALAKKNAAEAN
jgi:WD40 repeat protein